MDKYQFVAELNKRGQGVEIRSDGKIVVDNEFGEPYLLYEQMEDGMILVIETLFYDDGSFYGESVFARTSFERVLASDW